MAIPSGSGTEVLKRVTKEYNGNSQTSPTNDFKILDGVANHIYTILSINCYNTYSGDRTCKVNLKEDATHFRNLFSVTVGQDKTFFWEGKIILSGTDELFVFSNGNNSYWWISYIDQDFT